MNSEVYFSLPPPRNEVGYEGSRSVAPASLNALTELMWAPGFKAASNSGPIDTAQTPTDPAVIAGRSAFWTTNMDVVIQALIDSAVRDKLEMVARTLETRAGNAPYVKAWRVAAKIIRSNKPD